MYMILLGIFIEASSSSVGQPNLKWDHTSVSVCWGTPEDADDTNVAAKYDDLYESQAMKRFVPFKDVSPSQEFIRKKITEEYTIPRTGIEFVGWKPCNESPDADVVIIGGYSTNDKYDFGKSSLGQGGEWDNDEWDIPGLKPFVFLRAFDDPAAGLSMYERLLLSAVHEFGHLAGLQHEHQRPEIAFDPNERTTFCAFHEFTMDQSTLYYSGYDPNSIMNYCGVFALNHSGLTFSTYRNEKDEEVFRDKEGLEIPYPVFTDPTLFSSKELGNGEKRYVFKIGLSQGDVHALSCMYKSNSNNPKKTCNKYFDVYSIKNVPPKD